MDSGEEVFVWECEGAVTVVFLQAPEFVQLVLQLS